MSGCFTRIIQICLALIGLLLIFLVVRFFALDRSSALPAQTAAPRVVATSSAPPFNDASAIAGGATAVPVAIVIPEGISPSFTELCDSNDTLTKLQREGLSAAMVYKQIIGWTGTVYGIEHDGELYKVLVDMREDAIAARQVAIVGVSRDLAHTLHRAQQINFDGTIQEIVVSTKTICDPIVIMDAVITADQ